MLSQLSATPAGRDRAHADRKGRRKRGRGVQNRRHAAGVVERSGTPLTDDRQHQRQSADPRHNERRDRGTRAHEERQRDADEADRQHDDAGHPHEHRDGLGFRVEMRDEPEFRRRRAASRFDVHAGASHDRSIRHAQRQPDRGRDREPDDDDRQPGHVRRATIRDDDG
jgi:hypothetical protein